MGFGGQGEINKNVEIPPYNALPWELDFARAMLTEKAEDKIEALLLSMQKKTSLAGEFELQAFDPAKRALHQAYLSQALEQISHSNYAACIQILESKLFADGSALSSIEPSQLAKAYFWLGHSYLWSAKDEIKALKNFELGSKLEGTDFAAHCTSYENCIKNITTKPTGKNKRQWIDSYLKLYPYYRAISQGSNYNLLTESYDFDVYLSNDERTASIELHKSLKEFETQKAPLDPFAQYSMLFHLRNAQKISWPQQKGGLKAATYRNQLVGLALPQPASSMREAYLLLAELSPLDPSQLSILSQNKLTEYQNRLAKVQKAKFAPQLKKELKQLREKMSTTSHFEGVQ